MFSYKSLTLFVSFSSVWSSSGNCWCSLKKLISQFSQSVSSDTCVVIPLSPHTHTHFLGFLWRLFFLSISHPPSFSSSFLPSLLKHTYGYSWGSAILPSNSFFLLLFFFPSMFCCNRCDDKILFESHMLNLDVGCWNRKIQSKSFLRKKNQFHNRTV